MTIEQDDGALANRYLPEIPPEELPDFEAMTLDELVEWRVARKGDMYRAKAMIYASNEVYEQKVHAQTLATRLAASGLEGMEVTPEMVTIYAKGQKASPEVSE